MSVPTAQDAFAAMHGSVLALLPFSKGLNLFPVSDAQRKHLDAASVEIDPGTQAVHIRANRGHLGAALVSFRTAVANAIVFIAKFL